MVLSTSLAATAAPESAEIDSQQVSASQQDKAADYWTPERMEAATVADVVLSEDEAPDGSVARSTETSVPAQTLKPAVREEMLEPQAAAAPTDHIGKVFFTQSGRDYVCSANSVASTNKSTVATAGHCTNENGAWATNWVFAPAYDHGVTPYGLWSASQLFAPQQWVNGGDMNYDAAFAVVTPQSGSAALSDTVGGSGIAFNVARNQLYTSYGYPAAAPFDGESLQSCQGTAQNDVIGGTSTQGIPCNMTGGSSGGPWFLGAGPSGSQNSVNSFKYNIQPNVMYGPYFGDVIKSAYDTASRS